MLKRLMFLAIELILLINVKMSTIVGILTFMSRINAHLSSAVKKVLSYDVASGSEITTCNKMDKTFTGNVMMAITMLHT